MQLLYFLMHYASKNSVTIIIIRKGGCLIHLYSETLDKIWPLVFSLIILSREMQKICVVHSTCICVLHHQLEVLLYNYIQYMFMCTLCTPGGQYDHYHRKYIYGSTVVLRLPHIFKAPF